MVNKISIKPVSALKTEIKTKNRPLEFLRELRNVSVAIIKNNKTKTLCANSKYNAALMLKA